MVKSATDLSSIVDAYIEKLKKTLRVERVILSDVHTEGIDGEASEIVFIVVSPAFDGVDALQRAKALTSLGHDMSSLIVAFPYTSDEFEGFFRSDPYDGVLAQLLYGSREVYVQPGATPLHKLLKAAGGKR